MELISESRPLLIVVGAGGVGKTTLAAGLGAVSARRGRDTLVMTFDPSRRLKDTLGVGEEAAQHEVRVAFDAPATLAASLLDARRTFDRLVERYAPDEAARRRVLDNPFYQHLSGSLGGILEYMAVERLFEVATSGRYQQVILDTPPTRQALDFLEAPARIVGFLDSGGIKLALRPWFDEEGRLRATARWGVLGRRAERFLDEVVGLDLLRDMAEFFQAFSPLYAGFRERASAVEELLLSPRTSFVLVSGPGEERLPDTLFFARRLQEAGYHLGPIVVNRVHPGASSPGAEARGAASSEAPQAPEAPEPPEPPEPPDHSEDDPDGRALLAWLAERDRRGLTALAQLLSPGQPLASLPLRPDEPTHLADLEELGEELCLRLRGTS